jgi:hypothetical protein
MTKPYDKAGKSAAAKRSVLERTDPAYAGQAVYTRGTLRVYDTIVVRLSNSLIWRCPARSITEHYDRHLTGAHLEVGPGTGYYLDHARFADPEPHITLLDANVEVLRFAASRLRRYRPAGHAADVLKPIELAPASFRSVAFGYVLHCLPGNLATKAAAFDHVLPLVAPGGVVFGTTILTGGVRHNRLGRALLHAYNQKGVFANLDDDLAGLERALADRFARHEVEVRGAVALFAGWTSGGA